MHNVALFRCDDCKIFFKSKKGYEGHLAKKHAPKLMRSDGEPSIVALKRAIISEVQTNIVPEETPVGDHQAFLAASTILDIS